jgi:hypothetical protein
LKDRKKFPFNVTVHKIVKSDDPVFHDHPWPYTTIILKGGYWEHTPVFDDEGTICAQSSKWRGPGSIISRSANEFHWLELDPKVGPATTLFIMGQQQRDWGFLINKHKSGTQWIQWETYLSNYNYYNSEYIDYKNLTFGD